MDIQINNVSVNADWLKAFPNADAAVAAFAKRRNVTKEQVVAAYNELTKPATTAKSKP